MRYAAYVIVVGLVFTQFTVGAHAQERATTSAKAQDTVHAQGIVRDVDKDSNRVIISCDAVPALMWPPMTIGFLVRDKAMLTAVSPGARAEFDIRPQGDEFVIERITQTKAKAGG